MMSAGLCIAGGVGWGLKPPEIRSSSARAFAHFESANAFRRRVAPRFDRAGFAAEVERLIAVFDEDLFARLAGQGEPDERAVLVVGMPRSGTTLVEQILASHPRVHGAGESRALSLIARDACRASAAGDFPHGCRGLDAGALHRLGRDYLSRVGALAGDARA